MNPAQSLRACDRTLARAHRSRTVVAAVLAFAGAGAAFTGCGDSGQDAPTNSKTTGTSTQTPTSTVPTASGKGGTLRVRVRSLRPGSSKPVGYAAAATTSSGSLVQVFVGLAGITSGSVGPVEITLPRNGGRKLTFAAAFAGDDGGETQRATVSVAGRGEVRARRYRYGCLLPGAKTFCPLNATVEGSAIKVTVPSLAPDVPVVIAADVVAAP